MQEVMKTNNAINLPSMTGYSSDEISLMKNTVAKGTTDLEFAQFANVCKNTKLDPFLKEIWCIPMGSGNKRKVLMFASRDGFRKVAHKNPNFVSVNTMEVRAKDDFEMTFVDGELKIKHSFSASNKERGIIIGAYAVVKLKDGNTIIEWADFSEYNKGTNTWASHQSEMIKKVAEVHALKKVANLSGLYAEEEFHIKDGTIIRPPIENENEDKASQLLKKKLEKKESPKEVKAEVIEEKKVEKKKTIPKDEAEKLKKMIIEYGSKESDIIAYYKVSNLEELTYDQSVEICEILRLKKEKQIKKMEEEKKVEKKKDIIKDDEVIEVEPGEVEELSPAAKAMKGGMNKVKNKETVDPVPVVEENNEIVGMPGDVCAYLNSIEKIDNKDLPSDIIMLRIDSNRGGWKGYMAYPSLQEEIRKMNNK